jgi:hypothetical protein
VLDRGFHEAVHLSRVADISLDEECFSTVFQYQIVCGDIGFLERSRSWRYISTYDFGPFASVSSGDRSTET